MKKALISFIGGLLMTTAVVVLAQDTDTAQTPQDTTVQATEQIQQEDQQAQEQTTQLTEQQGEESEELKGHNLLLHYFIQGGPTFMGITLLTLILGLAFAIERIIVVSLAGINTEKLIRQLDEALANRDLEKAEEILKKTPGPLPKVLLEALKRVDDGFEIVEKTIEAHASVVTARLERNMVWISLFIAIAPMLGFMGTVIGMIQAFDAIEKAGDISPSLVAGGIKVALLTTLLGLIIAIILQIFYNYIMSRIDEIVTDLEDLATAFIDMLIKYKIIKK
ncbi:MAG: MotA/TolQ/ExbB proton channel family protein [Chlorobi bacterium]|nr:MotA/TolQ/ExbB proton channel family protein [Chlorobiota bacterium]